TVHRSGLDKHRGAHVVAAMDVGGELVEEIALIGKTFQAKVPEVVMGIADREIRLQRRFLGQGQPVMASVRHMGTSMTRDRGVYRADSHRPPVARCDEGRSAFLGGTTA